ncbi:MAG: DUF1778 domain-containing protein [Deltaproteobacteria bacterium]|nr:DUF1778 domain-containing protein [Deltaproteobacteria bacterium]
MRASTERQERLEARITKQQKALFQRAAELQGRSLSDFVVSSAQEAAMRAIQERTVMSLTARDQQALVSALLNPPAPSARLRKAAARHRSFAR